jgi:hypothetical protein
MRDGKDRGMEGERAKGEGKWECLRKRSHVDSLGEACQSETGEPALAITRCVTLVPGRAKSQTLLGRRTV